uniref:Endoplasmic reticulum vesicle transporter C-terminal domain-containing protein n=1 Tax=Haptolina ericina TaxID=156174 RepID=A0A7S3BPE8_9EUKA|mmetsp:Transcript_62961/g.140188  ORF Transcript_62961/g.140188 Transcript_62961/m.140188 type:complete len:394 (+) Transcript_62961:139-1320(+)
MRFSSFDVYPKTLKEFRQRTQTGAIISIVCATLIAILACIEISDFAQIKTHDRLFVDTSRGQKLRINVNVTFPALPCSVISLDALDLSGNHVSPQELHMTKHRLDAHGAQLPDLPDEPSAMKLPAYVLGGHHKHVPQRAPQRKPLFEPRKGGSKEGADDEADDDADDNVAGELAPALSKGQKGMNGPNIALSQLLAELLPNVFEDKQAIAELKKHVGEGCTYGGYMMVNKVAGNFHFALQKADHHTLMSVFGKREALNVSHVIHSISFGDEYPGMVNPLQNVRKILDHDSGYFQYYLKVVPTVYEPMGGKAPVHTNQYSYTELFRNTHDIDKLPAVFFNYEFSPIMARFTETRRSLSNFLTGLCAIVGGVFTVAGMVDACIHRFDQKKRVGGA